MLGIVSHGDAIYVAERLVLTREEVAEALGCSPRTVARLVERGELRQAQVGRLARYRREDVDALLAGPPNDDDRASTRSLATTTPAPQTPRRGSG